MEKISLSEANDIRITPIPFHLGDVIYLADKNIWKEDFAGTWEDWIGVLPPDPASAKNAKHFREAYQFWERSREVYGPEKTPTWDEYRENLLEQIRLRPYEVVEDVWLAA